MASLKARLDKVKQDKKAKTPGSAEEDQQQIAEVDNIRLSTSNFIKFVLNV